LLPNFADIDYDYNVSDVQRYRPPTVFGSLPSSEILIV